MITDEQILAVMAETFQVEVNTETSQLNCEKWDSIQGLNLVVNIEMTFSVDLTPDDINEMKDFVSIKNILTAKGK